MQRCFKIYLGVLVAVHNAFETRKKEKVNRKQYRYQHINATLGMSVVEPTNNEPQLVPHNEQQEQ